MATKKAIKKAVTVQLTQAEAMMSMIQSAASDPAVDIDKLDRLMKMYERTEDDKNKREFASAMVATQADIPVIEKSLKNKQTNSTYADLRDVLVTAKPIYTKHGLSFTFSEGIPANEGHVRVLCDVSHQNGYSKPYFIDEPIDNAGIKGSINKTAVHAKQSTFTYARRYLMGLILNLAFGDDDDGNGAGEPVHELIDEKHAKEMMDALDGSEKTLEGVLKFAKASCVAEIEVRRFYKIMEGIRKDPKKEEGGEDEKV